MLGDGLSLTYASWVAYLDPTGKFQADVEYTNIMRGMLYKGVEGRECGEEGEGEKETLTAKT